MAQVATSQLGRDAVAHPAGLEYMPQPVPELLHLKEENHTSDTQTGAEAIAHPSGVESLPQPGPELHHLKEENYHTTETQIGPNAIAPPAEPKNDLDFDDIPPFPDNVPTVPLLRINLQKLLDEDAEELENLWRACCDIGFFYLDLRGARSANKRDSAHDLPNKSTGGDLDGDGLLKDAAALFKLGERLFELPTEEKQKYDLKDQGSYFGYKGLGSGVVDAKGTRDRNEFYNVRGSEERNVA